MTILVHAVMCGGSGTRLWPLSRRAFPKQFLALVGERSLLQTTFERLHGLAADVKVMAIGSGEHAGLIAEQLRDIGGADAEILLEPMPRNTACVALIAALRAVERCGDDSLVLLSAADHYIGDLAAYRLAIERAIPVARSGRIVTFGVRPDRPETGYGYIEVGEELSAQKEFRAIASFREKPDHDTAARFVASGGFVWNAGIFLFSARRLCELAASLQPEMLAACRRALAEGEAEPSGLRLAREPFLAIEDISFDHAIMEKIGGHGAVLPIAAGWSDIGSWTALRALQGAPDGAGNIARGPVEFFDCDAVFGFSDGPLLVAHGLRNVIVVATEDAVYVASEEASQDVKKVVAALEERGRREAVSHGRERMPWGSSQALELSNGLAIRDIVVRPGETLHLEPPSDYAGRWMVVQGTADIAIAEQSARVAAGECIVVPDTAQVRVKSRGPADLRVICVRMEIFRPERRSLA